MKRPEVVQLRFIQPREHVEYGKIMVILPQDIGTDDDEEGEDVPPEPVPHQRLSHGSEAEQPVRRYHQDVPYSKPKGLSKRFITYYFRSLCSLVVVVRRRRRWDVTIGFFHFIPPAGRSSSETELP